MRFLDLIRKVRRKFSNYAPIVEVAVSRSRLLHNLHEYQNKYPRLRFAPVLKSNAYGHGLVEVAEILDKESIAFLVLDSLYEALVLRSRGIKSKILIIGYTEVGNMVSSRLAGASFAVTSLEQLKELAVKAHNKIKIHLKIDTGMNRQGLEIGELDEVKKILKGSEYLILEGICSHLSDADGDDRAFTREQIGKWNKTVSFFKKEFPEIEFFHLSNTAGAAYVGDIDANVGRLGLGLYGINASPREKLELEPVLEMRSVVSSVREVKIGESVGYNAGFVASKNMKAATVPTGYFEGVDRRLSNRGFFKIGATFCPIVGKVSMNITSIDVSGISRNEVKLGTPVTIISRENEDKNSAQNLAELCDTIPYEILVHIPQHLRRTVAD